MTEEEYFGQCKILMFTKLSLIPVRKKKKVNNYIDYICVTIVTIFAYIRSTIQLCIFWITS